MRALIVLAVLGVCSAFPFIQDAPDVAAEKARFFHAYRAAQAAALPQYNAVAPQQAYTRTTSYQQPRWTGPVAATIPAAVDGTITPVSNTNEVAAARSHFFNAYKAQVAATAPKPGSSTHYQAAPSYSPAPVHYQAAAPAPVQPRWTGPVAATIPAGLPGSSPHVIDTPEVAAAKNAFFHEYNRQVAAAAPPSVGYY